jgi:EmrB/QacA subfamily drug resistance transporter
VTNVKPASPQASQSSADHKTLALLVIAGAQLMIVLDVTIVNVALKTMADALHKTQVDMTWAINAYTLTFGGLLLLGGKAGDVLGRRRMFTIGLSLFTFGSFIGGLAPNYEVMILGRVVQGVGGAIASPTALALIATEFKEGPERTKAFAVFSAVAGVGGAIGLILGGILTEWISWRAIFFVNVPIGALLVYGASRYLHRVEGHPGRFDFVGAITSTVGMTSLVYGFINAAHPGQGWESNRTIAAFVVAAVLIATFLVLESRLSFAMLPLKIFRNATRSGGYVVMAVLGAGMFGTFFFLTFFVRGVLGYSVLKTGLSFLPFSAAIMFAAQLSARKLLPTFGPRVPVIAGTVLATSGLLWLSTISPSSTYLDLLPAMVLMALGMGSLFVPLMTLAVAGAAPHEAGIASAVLNVSQQVGGAIGLSLLTTVFSTAATSEGKKQAADLAAQVKAGRLAPSVLDHFAQFRGDVQSQAALADNAAVHAARVVQSHGSSVGFLVASGLTAFGFLVALFFVRTPKGIGAPPMAAAH